MQKTVRAVSGVSVESGKNVVSGGSWVSVVVPVHNAELYLEECIESILQQSFKDLELVLVDDGSTDDSGRICDQYALRDERVKVIHKENEGVAKACRIGIEDAAGKYLLFVDSDDWIDLDMVEQLYYVAEKYGTDVVLCHFMRESGDKSTKRKMHLLSEGVYDREKMAQIIFPELISDGTFEGRIVAADTRGARLFRKDIVTNNMVFYRDDLTTGEDYVLALPAILDARLLYAFSDYYPYHYRKVQTSVTQAYIENMWQKMLLLNNQIELIAETKAVYDFKLQIRRELVKYAIITINHLFRHKELDADYIIKSIKDICNDSKLKSALENLDFSGYERNKKIMLLLIKWNFPLMIYFLKVFQVKYLLRDS